MILIEFEIYESLMKKRMVVLVLLRGSIRLPLIERMLLDQ